MLGIALSIFSLAGCTLKIAKLPAVSTGAVQEITWTTIVTWTTENTGVNIPSSTMEEITGEFDSWVVPVVTGSETVVVQQSGVMTEVKDLINNRKTQPKDTTKLNEEDISLMEQIIQKVQNLGK